MAIQPTQPQSIGGVLDISFQLYKSSVGAVWPICLLLVLGSAAPLLYLITQGGAITPNPDNPLAALAIYSDPGYWVSTLVNMVVSLLGMGAMYLKLQAIASDEQLSLGSALQTSLGRLPTQFAAAILYGLAVAVGSLLLLVPGVILMVSLMLCWIIATVEAKGPIAALMGSHHLVWGNWWRTTAILTVGVIILFVIYVAVGLVVGLVIPFVGFRNDPLMIGFVTSFIVGGLIALLVTPFYIALLLSIYWDLKLRKEGGDLAERVGALGAA